MNGHFFLLNLIYSVPFISTEATITIISTPSQPSRKLGMEINITFFFSFDPIDWISYQVKSCMLPHTLFYSLPFQMLLVLYFSSGLRQAAFHSVIHKCESWQNVGAETRHILLKSCGDISRQKQACVLGLSGVLWVLTLKMTHVMFSYI